ncbi:hypothetical protein ALC56_05921 [Trachymyrmex septentrionalis]|uniref:Uncharacterized protein n=1 Tax=Trachymyrmex septentrionalis TaxID=34720 RepID=A0A195FGA1_9HYME|nr:hypothetical protein ALC56_05921 [Trachymyrmex septentrionalis]
MASLRGLDGFEVTSAEIVLDRTRIHSATYIKIFLSVSRGLFLLNLIAAFPAIVFALDIGVRAETSHRT